MDADDITIEEGIELVRLARTSVESYIKNRKIINSPIKSNKKLGVFVTVYHLNTKNSTKNLRGFIGYIIPIKNIYDSIIAAAINDATKDPRFSANSERE